MSYAARITRVPIPFDAAPAAEAAALASAAPAPARKLIAGAAGCSPYLSGLITRAGPSLGALLEEGPEAAIARVLARVRAADGGAAEIAALLRHAKADAALAIALADLGGVWTLEEVTGALTALADAAVSRVLSAALAEEARRGRIPAALAEGAPGGPVAFAMGKMGAGELNVSSDIDLIFLFDETRHDPDDVQEIRASFIRAVRRAAGLLSDMTPEGYVFRTDLRLRPDAAVTPVCISMGAAEQYYEAQGRTWERAAWIKARPCAGDIEAGARFQGILTPFVWRRHLDFAAIQDAHDMRLRIRAHKGLGGRFRIDGHNIKLGAGGIREIEFFTQTRQLIAGGRDPGLRDRATVPALHALADKGWTSRSEAGELVALYRAHRELEHRLQLVADARTHALPATPEAWDRIARMCGEGDTAAYRDGVAGRLAQVAALTEGFFDPAERQRARAAAPPVALTPEMRATVDGWRSYPALRSGRAVESFRRIEPDLLARLFRAAHPGEALNQFDAFLAGLPAGVQLFALFEANPQLVDLIVDICATAPGLAQYLSRNARVLDAVLGGEFFTPWPGSAALAEALSRRLGAVGDYERKLDAARVWASEWHFRIGVHHLRGLTDALTAGREYADLAAAVLAALWPVCAGEFARRHGPPPGRGAAVLGMGSLGAGRITSRSDLDLIVIYDGAGAEASDGPRPLPVRTYYARLTQAFVTALTAPMAEGRLYAVDMRLRPSGRQGPVAVSLAAFRAYQMDEAWTWEHLALTRARTVAGDPALAADVEAARTAVIAAKSGDARIASDTADMRRRIFASKAPDGLWDAKTGPGRLQDIELFAQSLALRAGSARRQVEEQIADGRKAGLIGADEGDALARAWRLLWRLQASARLLTDRPLDMEGVGEGGRAFLLRETGARDLDDLARMTEEGASAAAAVIAAGLGAAPGGEGGDAG